MNDQLSALAEERRLVTFAQALRRSSHEFTASRSDLDMRMPLRDSFESELASLTRRGLRLGDVDNVLARFAVSPLEGALVAWSALKQRRFSVDETPAAKALFARVAPALPLVAELSECWLKGDGKALVEAIVADGHTSAIEGTPFGLGRLEALRQQGGLAALHEGDQLARVRQAAWSATLGRLTSLGWAYFVYLWRVAGYPTAMLEYCELALDEKAYALLPSASDWEGLHASFAPLRGYVEGRLRLATGDRAGAAAALAAMATDDPGGYRLLLASELDPKSAANDTAVRRLEAICAERPLWKHAQRIRTMATLHRDLVSGADAPSLARVYAQFEATFGFDLKTFLLANVAVPREHELRALLEQRLVRNLIDMPFDTALWFDLAARLPDRDALWAELRYRRQTEGT